MSRASAPTLHCDHESCCDEWTIDDFGLYVDSVNGVRLSARHRALGWTTVGDEDFCSEHAPDREVGSHEGHRIQESPTLTGAVVPRFCRTCETEIAPRDPDA